VRAVRGCCAGGCPSGSRRERCLSEQGRRGYRGARLDRRSGSSADRLYTEQQAGLHPHYSSGDVSGHGAWKRGNCTNDVADVYNCLYEYYTDGSWRQKACSATERIYAGGGSANRTTARATCDNRYLTSWRNHIDVDVVDEIDTGENP